jgi:transcriptional regulator with XRE-family HTH domain
MIMFNFKDSAATLRTLRREKRLTQFELSRRARVHPSTISRAESARYVLSLVEARRLARVLGVDPKALTTE